MLRLRLRVRTVMAPGEYERAVNGKTETPCEDDEEHLGSVRGQ
jgi:hypothetical protein